MLRRVKMYLNFLISVLRVNRGLLVGMWRLTKLPQPAITIFGGTKLSLENPHSQKVCNLAEKLAHAGFSIITGGGPGIMEAANLGAMTHLNNNDKKKGKIEDTLVTVGIGLSKLEDKKNRYVQEYIIQPYFFTRKWLLVRYSVGFIVAPGGFGTLDELTEVLTLIQTHYMPNTPVVLIGKDYWKPFFDWIHQSAVKEGLLDEKSAHIVKITDDVDEAFNIIQSQCAGFVECGIEARPR